MHWVTVTADVEKAFLMVSMAEKDCNILCFLWVDDVLTEHPNDTEFWFTRIVWCVP